MREPLSVYQPEHLWEVRERLLHRLVTDSESDGESCGEGNDWEQVSTSQSTRGR